ncbi:MAG: threonine/serine dehydratase [Zavarzinella sp.]
MLTIEMIQAAKKQLEPYLSKTPLLYNTTLSTYFGAKVSLKLECFQKTGSFKPRGAFNKMLSLAPEQKQHGVVAVSGGNHAQGVAFAASTLGIDAVVCMPSSTPENYLAATRSYGATVLLTENIHAAFRRADELQQEGRTLVHPFDDPLVAAGQGTIGLEILEDAPDATHVVVSIGGGGLFAGVGTALRAANPHIKLTGVETSGADAMAHAFAAGQPVELPAITSIARTLGAPKVSPMTLHMARQFTKEIQVVSDADTVKWLVFLLERAKVLAEPAAACCLAAADRLKGSFQPTDHLVILICGGNAALSDLCGWKEMLK